MRPHDLEAACKAHLPYSAPTAREIAQRHRDNGEPFTAWRCPECGRWHVGHPPSLTGLEAIAIAIRERSGNAPTPIQEQPS